MPKRMHILTAAVMVAALAGCTKPQEPATVITCFVKPGEVAGVSRVAFVELTDEVSQPEVSRDMTESLFRALQGRRLFHVEVFRLTDPPCAALPPNKFGPYTLQDLSEMRQVLGCDAVLLGKVDTYQPYPRMQIGIYLRMLDLKSGQTVWSVDHVWDTRDKKTEKRIKDFFEHQLGRDYEPVNWELGTISPSLFEKFIAFETANTLGGPEEK